MNRAEILSNHFKSNKSDTLKKLSARSGVHWVTISKIKNGEDCFASTWDKIESAIRDSQLNNQ